MRRKLAAARENLRGVRTVGEAEPQELPWRGYRRPQPHLGKGMASGATGRCGHGVARLFAAFEHGAQIGRQPGIRGAEVGDLLAFDEPDAGDALAGEGGELHFGAPGPC